MIKLLKWIIIIVVIVVLYFQFGGSQVFKKVGKKGIEIGQGLEKMENKAKNLSRKIKKNVEKRVDKARENIGQK